jgi:hypothetical protein
MAGGGAAVDEKNLWICRVLVSPLRLFTFWGIFKRLLFFIEISSESSCYLKQQWPNSVSYGWEVFR